MARKTGKKYKGGSLKPRTPSAEKPTHRFTHRNRTVRNPNGLKQNSSSKSRKNSPTNPGMCVTPTGRRVRCNTEKMRKYKELHEQIFTKFFPRD